MVATDLKSRSAVENAAIVLADASMSAADAPAAEDSQATWSQGSMVGASRPLPGATNDSLIIGPNAGPGSSQSLLVGANLPLAEAGSIPNPAPGAERSAGMQAVAVPVASAAGPEIDKRRTHDEKQALDAPDASSKEKEGERLGFIASFLKGYRGAQKWLDEHATLKNILLSPILVPWQIGGVSFTKGKQLLEFIRNRASSVPEAAKSKADASLAEAAAEQALSTAESKTAPGAALKDPSPMADKEAGPEDPERSRVTR